MNEFPTEALLLHLLAMAGMLSVVCYLLHRRGLFHWLSAGFWMAGALALYFFLTPLMNWLTGQTSYLETRLAVSGGVPRLQWVTFMIVMGAACFYGAYFNTRLKPVTSGVRDDRLPAGTWIIMTLALLAAAYAIIMFRGSFAVTRDQVVIEGGEFTGDVTGYQYVAHMLALFPLVLMLAYKKTRKLGLVLTACYVIVRFEDGWDRYSIVSLLLAISMLTVSLKRKQWPDKKWISVIALIVLILTLRGHSGLLDYWRSDTIGVTAAEETITGGGDTGMLGTLWVHTFLCDRSGYNYGVPFLNHVLFGFLPRKYFPWKDTVIEPVATIEISNVYPEAVGMMSGAKSTVIGDLYSWGGLLTVALGMACLGYLSRRLDGMVADTAPLPTRMLGFLWLGAVWMLFASALTWVAANLFLIALPFFGLYLCDKLFDGQRKTLPENLAKRMVASLPDTGRVK